MVIFRKRSRCLLVVQLLLILSISVLVPYILLQADKASAVSKRLFSLPGQFVSHDGGLGVAVWELDAGSEEDETSLARRNRSWRDVMTAMLNNSITPILLQPKLLMSLYYATTSETKTSTVAIDFNHTDQFVTLGILDQDSDAMKNVKWPTGWEYFKTSTADTRLLDPKPERIVAHHWVAFRPTTIVHIPVVFNRRGNFNWIAEIDPSPRVPAFLGTTWPQLVKEAAYKYPIAFLGDFAYQETSWGSILIAYDINLFMWQNPLLHFQECDYKRVSKYRNLTKTKEKQEHNRKLALVLRRFRSEMYTNYSIPVWLIGSTLLGLYYTLGWYRQCGAVNEESNFLQFATNISFHSADIFANISKNDENIRIESRYQQLPDNVKYVFRIAPENVTVELFFHAANQSKSGSFTSDIWLDHKQAIRYNYPAFTTLCGVELLEDLYLAPCNSEKFVAADFGNDPFKGVVTRSILLNKKHRKNLELGVIYNEPQWKNVLTKFI